MYIMKVKLTFPDESEKIYDVGAAFEIRTESETFLAMRRLSDGDFGFIPIETIKSWEIVE